MVSDGVIMKGFNSGSANRPVESSMAAALNAGAVVPPRRPDPQPHSSRHLITSHALLRNISPNVAPDPPKPYLKILPTRTSMPARDTSAEARTPAAPDNPAGEKSIATLQQLRYSPSRPLPPNLASRTDVKVASESNSLSFTRRRANTVSPRYSQSRPETTHHPTTSTTTSSTSVSTNG